MQSTLTIIFLAFFIGAAQSQTWTGSYTTDSSCSTSACCCLTGQVVLSNCGSTSCSISSSVTGVCNNATTFSSTAYINGYTGWMFVTSNATLALSSDSRTITVSNPSNTACNGKGVKSAAITQYVNINMLLATFLLTVMMNFSKI